VALALLGVIAAANSGCGVHRISAHDAVGSAAEQAAVVYAENSVWVRNIVFIQRVDGAPVERRAFRSQEVEVLPGLHTFEVSYVGGDSHSTSNVVVSLQVEAGRRYQIKAEPIRESFWKGIIPGEGTWTAWVEDAATGAVVAGQRARGLFTTTLDPPVPPATK
jgi:hypothetical protein